VDGRVDQVFSSKVLFVVRTTLPRGSRRSCQSQLQRAHGHPESLGELAEVVVALLPQAMEFLVGDVGCLAQLGIALDVFVQGRSRDPEVKVVRPGPSIMVASMWR
jgi:hypothetical protein